MEQVIEKIGNNARETSEAIQCFIFNNFGLDIVVETQGTKVTCVSCLKMFERINSHWYKSLKCAKAVDQDKFKDAYDEYKKEEVRMRNTMKCKKYADKQKAKDGTWKEKERQRKSQYREKARQEGNAEKVKQLKNQMQNKIQLFQ